jgi:hypothetical protein
VVSEEGTVVSLCDYSGVMVAPWAEAGYRAVCIDTQHERGARDDGGVVLMGQDVTQIEAVRNAEIVFAFPPCTNLAVSGARWFKDKGLRGLIDALEVVEACRRIAEGSGAPWMIENPVSTLSTYWRKPDHIFNPCDYAGYLDSDEDAYTKKTCLWVGGGFVMPEPKRMEPVHGSKMHLMAPSPERANLRSRTPRGFALAVFQANCRERKERTA